LHVRPLLACPIRAQTTGDMRVNGGRWHGAFCLVGAHSCWSATQGIYGSNPAVPTSPDLRKPLTTRPACQICAQSIRALTCTNTFHVAGSSSTCGCAWEPQRCNLWINTG